MTYLVTPSFAIHFKSAIILWTLCGMLLVTFSPPFRRRESYARSTRPGFRPGHAVHAHLGRPVRLRGCNRNLLT